MVMVDGEAVGELFRVHPNVEDEYGIDTTYVCELDFEKLPYALKTANKSSKYQASYRDLSILMPSEMEFATLKGVIDAAKTPEVIRYYAVDRYSDASLGTNVSLSIRFVLQSNEKTLEEEDITSAMQSILDGLKDELGIGLR
jgi:phenylalanyl-tRNA synthetase beta chain